MYDASFDHREGSHAWDRRWLWTLRIAAVALLAVAASSEAQMPGTPVLQNAWATPGMVGAIDFGGGADGSTYAGAISFTPGNGRLQFSGGLGVRNRTGAGSGGVYGLRLAIPFSGATSSFGFAGFVGVGGGGSSKSTTTTSGTTGSSTDSTASTAQVPVGVAVGWRRAVGGSHGVSVYATPNYVFFSGGSKTGGLFRAGIGADVGITGSLGVTAGAEFGGTRGRAVGGPSGVLYGIGVSYAFRRQ